MKKTNKRLIDSWGRISYGVLDTPVDVINYRDFDLRTVMDKPRSALARKTRFNQFQFISAMSPGWVFGLAVVDLKLVSTAFFYLYDFKTGQMLEQSLTQPLAMGTHIEPRPETGVTEFRKGKTCVRITSDGHSRGVSVSGPDDLQITLNIEADTDPLRLVCPAGYSGWVFTRKSAGLPVSGNIRWQGQNWQCDSLSRVAVDWSCGFMRRETAWNWASLAGVLAGGRAVGLNLAAGVNETGMTENALWLEGRCIKLGQARFVFDRYDEAASWQVSTDDGRVELTFRPSGVRRERLNAWLMASNFRQYIGTFSGTVRDEEGNSVPVDGLRGLMEDHFARW